MQPQHLLPGDPAIWFSLDSSIQQNFHISNIGGRYVVLFFYGSCQAYEVKNALHIVRKKYNILINKNFFVAGISVDPADRENNTASSILPDMINLWDVGGKVSRAYGALPLQADAEGIFRYQPFWLIMDPQLRVLKKINIERTPEIFDYIIGLPSAEEHAGVAVNAPILILPRIFETEFCRALIEDYHKGNPVDSGFMRDVGGKTVGVIDHSFKRRHDVEISYPLRAEAKWRIERRLIPELRLAFQFQASRMERYIVACYNGQDGGFFSAHRDNTTHATSHRRFAVTINLNAEEFTGGELRLPEFGNRTYRAPTGGAVIFSCSLLHEAMPVTSGTRYAFLPFLYDEQAARTRDENRKFLSTEGL